MAAIRAVVPDRGEHPAFLEATARRVRARLLGSVAEYLILRD